MVLERSGYLTHVPGLRISPEEKTRQMVLCTKLLPDLFPCRLPRSDAVISLSTDCHLDTTHTWVRCLALVNQTGVGVQSRAMARGATTASIVETR